VGLSELGPRNDLWTGRASKSNRSTVRQCFCQSRLVPEEVLTVFRNVRDQIKSGFTDFYGNEIKPVTAARFGSAN
jgi:hypothetical protein